MEEERQVLVNYQTLKDAELQHPLGCFKAFFVVFFLNFDLEAPTQLIAATAGPLARKHHAQHKALTGFAFAFSMSGPR